MVLFDPVICGTVVSGTKPWISWEASQATLVYTYLRSSGP